MLTIIKTIVLLIKHSPSSQGQNVTYHGNINTLSNKLVTGKDQPTTWILLSCFKNKFSKPITTKCMAVGEGN